MPGLGILVATRNVADVTGRSSCTEFQLYLGARENVVDFTERKLVKYADSIDDPQQKCVVNALILEYRLGRVAIAWKRGKPIILHVTRET